jgi:hypothetical protein
MMADKNKIFKIFMKKLWKVNRIYKGFNSVSEKTTENSIFHMRNLAGKIKEKKIIYPLDHKKYI